MKQKTKKIPVEEIVDIYEKKACNLTATAKALAMSRMQLYNWRAKNRKLDEAMRQCEESMLDNTESELFKQIKDGNITAIIFFLKTKGKNRGYYEKVENNVKTNAFEELMKSLPDKDED